MAITINTTRFLCLLVFLSLVHKGSTQSEDCPLNALWINQTPTGREIKSKKEWNVSIKHICVTCELSEVNVTCPNLERSIIKVNRAVISKTRSGKCQLNGGKQFDTDTKLTFTYVWDRIDFKPLDFFTTCY